MSLDRLLSAIQKETRTIVGLMSGMSMDGVDLAMVRVEGRFPDLTVELLATYYRKYDSDTRRMLTALQKGTVSEVCEGNFLVAREFAQCVLDFLSERKMDPAELDAIGSHGQTVCHIPPGTSATPSTLQIGAGSIIAELTGVPTISNFRVRDMIVGGQGAPLIPIADFVLYRRPDEIVVVNNLGSISNVTVVTPALVDVIAFDTGPANMPIDFFAARMPDNPSRIDRDGVLSAQGRVLEDALTELLSIPFLRQAPPRAAGYGEFGPTVLSQWADRYGDRRDVDLLRTAVEFSARSIADAYERYIMPRFPTVGSALFTGGGTYNATLMNRIRELLPQLKVEALSHVDAPRNDAKEALGFALLANETLCGRAGNVPSATGARKAVVLGEIAP